MSKKSWRILIFCLLMLFTVLILSSCQLGKDIQNTAHAFSHVPDRLMQGLINLMDGIKNVGTALGDSIRSIVGGMTGR